jgi:hypothetical protein
MYRKGTASQGTALAVPQLNALTGHGFSRAEKRVYQRGFSRRGSQSLFLFTIDQHL